MDIKLSFAEFNVMKVLWQTGSMKAIDIANITKDQIGWEKNTTYTLINRLIKKGAIKRTEPNFICESIINQSEVQIAESKSFLDKMYNGSLNMFVKAFLSENELSDEEIAELKNIINKYK